MIFVFFLNYYYPIDSKNTSICTVFVPKICLGCVKKDNNTIFNMSSFSIYFWCEKQRRLLKYVEKEIRHFIHVQPRGSKTKCFDPLNLVNDEILNKSCDKTPRRV